MRTFTFTAILALLSSGCSSSTSGPDPGRPITTSNTALNVNSAAKGAEIAKRMIDDLKNGSSKRDTAPAPPIPSDDSEYDSDLAGQYQRIKAEGTDNALVQKNIADADKSVKYEHLKKNAEKYAGRPWMFTGKILQIMEQGGETQALISLDDWGSKTIWVVAPFTTDFVEKNRVTVVGYTAGSYSYTSQANYNLTVPAVAARAILKPGAKK